MEDVLISVIVPVYNTGKYIEQCLDSIISQTYRNLEIIAVDGDTPDNAGEICDCYAKKDNRIKVIHKQNKGVNDNRKAGLKAAKGIYIGFVDSDDWLEPQMYENLLALSIENEADIVCSGINIHNKYEIRLEHDAIPEGRYEDKDYLCDNLIYFENSEKPGIYPGINHKLFRREVIYDNYMELDNLAINSEDMALTIVGVLSSKYIYITHSAYYNYRKHEGSNTSTSDPIYFKRINLMLEYVRNKLDVLPHTEGLERQLDRYSDQMFMIGLGTKYRYYHEGTIPEYIFPTGLFDKKARLVLYGAGYYGGSYHKQFSKRNGYNLVLWVDRDSDKYGDEVKPVEEIMHTDFDVLVIAVKYKNVADSIRENLIRIGVEQSKILWSTPVYLLDCV